MDKLIELNINHIPLGEIETEYVLGHEEFNNILSEPEVQELLYLIQDDE